jgi:hypothetical protein
MKNAAMSWLRNRYTLTLGSIAALAISWNIYVALNNHGIITGRVVTADQRPVSGATVVLSERSLLVAVPKGRATTNEKGEFRFAGHSLHHLYLEAYKEGAGRMAPKEFRLYFQGQNLLLEKPLVLADTK